MMQRQGLSYRAVREVLETPQDVMDYWSTLAHVAAARAKELGS